MRVCLCPVHENQAVRVYEGTTGLLSPSLGNESLAGTSTDILVNSLVEDAIEGLSALFTSHLSSLVSRLERRFLHRSVAHLCVALLGAGSLL